MTKREKRELEVSHKNKKTHPKKQVSQRKTDNSKMHERSYALKWQKHISHKHINCYNTSEKLKLHIKLPIQKLKIKAKNASKTSTRTDTNTVKDCKNL